MNKVELENFAKRARQRLVDSIKGYGNVEIPVYDYNGEIWYYAVNITDEKVDVVLPADLDIYRSGFYSEGDFVVTSYYFDELSFNELYDIAFGVALLEEE